MTAEASRSGQSRTIRDPVTTMILPGPLGLWVCSCANEGFPNANKTREARKGSPVGVCDTSPTQPIDGLHGSPFFYELEAYFNW